MRLMGVLLAAAVVLVGCKYENTGDQSKVLAEIERPVETVRPTFPDVAGVYSFTTGILSYECSDGSFGQAPEFSQNSEVVQDGNEIRLFDTTERASSESVGFVFKSETETKGLIQRNGRFSLSKSALATFIDFSMDARLSYSFVGTFDSTGWFGDYEYSATFLEAGYTCTYRSVFYGDLIRK